MNQIVGHPVPYKIGRKTYLVGYVSMGEWYVYRELLKVDKTQALLEFIYWALRRGMGNAPPAITRRKVRRIVRWHPKSLLGLVDLIHEISLPKIKAPEAGVIDPEALDSAHNQKIIFRTLSRIHNWTPQQISDMSPVQIYSYAMGGEDGTGRLKMSGAEYKAFRARGGTVNYYGMENKTC